MLEKSVFYDVFTNGVDCFEENGDSFAEVCVCVCVSCKSIITLYQRQVYFFSKNYGLLIQF